MFFRGVINERTVVSGPRRKSFLSGGGTDSSDASRGGWRLQSSRRRSSVSQESGAGPPGIGHGADLRHSFRAREAENKGAKTSKHECIRVGFFGAGRRRRSNSGSTQKELARLWYGLRREERQRRKEDQNLKEVRPHREEGIKALRPRRSRCQGSDDQSCSELLRSSARTPCPSAGSDFEGFKEESNQKAKCFTRQSGQRLRQQQWRKQRVMGERCQRSCESSDDLQEVRAQDVPATAAICETLCEDHRERARGRGHSLPHCRLQQEDLVWQAEKPSTLSLPGVGHFGDAASRRTRKGGTSDCADTPGDASSGDRSRLGSGVDADPRGRSFQKKAVGRRCRVSAACDKLSQIHERAGQEHGSHPSEEWLSQRCGGSDKGERQERKRQAEGQRQGQACCRCLSRELTRDPKEVKVLPDAGTSPVHSFDCIDSLQGSWGSFGRFLKLLKSSRLDKRLGPRTPPVFTKGDSLFPSLLVIPESEGKSKGARSRARRRGRDEAWRHVGVVWAYFTFLEGGSPHSRIEQQRLLERASHARWTSLHSEYAGFLHSEIHRFVRLQSHDVPLSRGILKLSELVKVVKNSNYTSSHAIEKLANVAKNVEPSRMSLPDVAGIIEPEKFLKGEHREVFNSMISVVPHDQFPNHPTQSCFKVDPERLHEVNKKLLASGVATLIPAEMGMRDSTGRLITGGLFAVDHKPESDRVILDRRPFNELERRLVWARLPHGSLLTQLIVPKGYSVRGSGDDLSNYFYLIKHHEEWLPRNAVGSVFDGKGYEMYGGEPGKDYLLSFRVVAMGDLNAVDIAQQVHLEILRDCDCMHTDECIEFQSPLPASHTLEGLYIDDHIVTQILPSKKNRPKHKKFRDEIIIESSRNHYKSQNIPTSKKKAFQKADRFTAWGTEIDNKSGRIGAPLVKLKHLSKLLTSVCQLKRVSKKLLQGMTGLLVHPFMHRRSLMSILQDTFLHIEKLGDKESRPLPVSVKEELLCAALLLPLAHSNCRWEVSPRIGASDASLTHGGRAAALVPDSVAQTLYRFSENRGEHVRLDWARAAVVPESRMNQAPQELEQIITDLPWNSTETCSFGHKQHINILEANMIFRELRDTVHSCTDPLRCVVLVDSRAAAGAWSKGRSSARNLNRILRRALGWTLAGRKSLHLVWVRSGANPSDYPSRNKPIPEPPVSASELTSRVIGAKLPYYRTRKSNREIWREVKKRSARISPECEPSSPDPSQSDRTVERDVSANSISALSDLGKNQGSRQHPAAAHWSFREVFAGKGGLTKAFHDRKVFKVLQPVKLMQRGKATTSHDLLFDETFGRLCQEACQPRQIWHFGFPCGSFSLMQNLNKGTRSASDPLGDGSLERETKGNEVLFRTIHLCKLLDAHGSFFTLEIPSTSYAWHVPLLKSLIHDKNCKEVLVDQCRYGLKTPGQCGKLGLAQKLTLFVGTMPGLEKLSKRCQHDHQHVQIIVKAKVNKKWKKRSTLAGFYPQALCEAFAKQFEAAFEQ